MPGDSTDDIALITGVDGTTTTTFSTPVPEVAPNSKIYFLQLYVLPRARRTYHANNLAPTVLTPLLHGPLDSPLPVLMDPPPNQSRLPTTAERMFSGVRTPPTYVTEADK